MVKKKSHGQDFIKLVLQSVIEDKKMIIPPKFVMKFRDTLSDSADLARSSNCTWRVGLKKENQSIYFDKNWHEFVELHSIRQGYMLLFSYKGNSSFDVVIFDHSYCETHKHRKVEVPSMVWVKEEVIENAVEAAIVFKPQKSSFQVILKPYNINRYMYIGMEFAGCLRGVSSTAKIVNAEGRGWVVTFMRKPNNSLMLLSGWCKFVRENDLKAGDVCVFEMIEGKNNEVKVTKFRES